MAIKESNLLTSRKQVRSPIPYVRVQNDIEEKDAL
jgi:hypothetical protein